MGRSTPITKGKLDMTEQGAVIVTGAMADLA